LLTIRAKLFESNAGAANTNNPPTYATNLHFAGTGKQPRNNVLATLGSNFSTAYRMWCKSFEEKTGVDWDDRIKAHNERVRDRARDGDTPGLYSTRRGENGDIKSKARAAEDAVPFEKRKFEYMPPLHSARGWLPDGKEEVPEVLRQMRTKPNGQNDRTEQWMMSGGNGALTPRQSIEDTQIPVQIDPTDDDPWSQLAALNDGSGGDAPLASTGATHAAARGLEGGMSDEMNSGAYVDSLLAGTAQDDVFNVDDLAGQHQQNFVFDQDGTDYGIENSGTEAAGIVLSSSNLDTVNAAVGTSDADLLANALPGETPSYFASLPDQTQLAIQAGQDLFDQDPRNRASETGPDETDTAVGGIVIVPETEQLEVVAGVRKRKRNETEMEDMEPAAKRFSSEEFGSEESAA